MYKYITDYNDNIQAVNISASSGVNQMDNFSINIATVHYVGNDEASGDRAEKCYISNHYCRKRFVALQITTTGKYNVQCMQSLSIGFLYINNYTTTMRTHNA